MSKTLQKISAITILIIGLSSCGGGGSSSNSDETGNIDESSENIEGTDNIDESSDSNDEDAESIESTTNVNLTAIQGTWITQCYPAAAEADILPTTPRAITSLTFTDNNVLGKTTVYSDIDCSVILISSYTTQSTTSIGSLITTTTGVQANKVDSNVFSINGSATDIDTFDIISISENVLYFGNPFDDTKDASSEANREDTLYFNIMYLRQ